MDINDMLVVTIVIQMHGSLISYKLTPETTDIFQNVRLLCKAGGLNPYVAGVSGMPGILEEFMLVGNLQDIFRRDISSSTYEIISAAKSGLLIGNITFDKTLSTITGRKILDTLNPLTYLQGIYLLSIHRNQQLIYPVDPSESAINFLKVEDLHKLAGVFGTAIPDLRALSTAFPDQQIYIDRENRVKKNLDLSSSEKDREIEEIRGEYYGLLQGWNLTMNSRGIESIKLSYLVDLIKRIIGRICVINLLDYSCNSPTIYMPEETKSSSKFFMSDDIEQGMPYKEYGGKRKQKKRRNLTNNGYKKKRKKRRKFTKKYRSLNY